MMRLSAAVVALSLLSLVGCESNTADTRLRKYLRIDSRTPLTESGIRTAALRLIPLGSDEQLARKIIAEAGIGSDPYSSYYPPDSDRTAYIVIGLDPTTFGGSVKREYVLALRFSRAGRLEDILATAKLTGL